MHTTLVDWLKYLEQIHNIPIDLGLERINIVKMQLDLDNKIKVPIITVAGTNGKGSTCSFLASIFQAGNYKVGLYTSPHLLCFNERIKIDGIAIDDESLIQAFNQVEEARLITNISLSYFEFTTLAAMLIFIKTNLDVIILEVGLGGRLDAVNIFEPSCTIVTSIGIDHTEYLGTTREQIAIEKAGIFRKNIPAICGDLNPPLSLMNIAKNINVNLFCMGQEFSYSTEENQWNWSFIGKDNLPVKNIHSLAHPALRGINQLQNASCAIMALHALRYILPVTNQDIRRGLIEVELDGRLTILAGQPSIVLDVAHNSHATAVLADNLDRMGFYTKNIAIFSAMQDKDIEAMLIPMKNIIDEWHICPLPTERSASVHQLQQAIEKICLHKPIYIYKSVDAAYVKVRQLLDKEHRLVVFGSFYTVAQALKYKNMSEQEIQSISKEQENIANTSISRNRIKSFVKRGGRTTEAQKLAIDNLSNQWCINYKNTILDFSQIFNNRQDTILEIGFGMGESTAHIAKLQPHNNFIGAEVHVAGVGALLKLINDNKLDNIRIIQHDAVEVLEKMIPNESLAGIHIFFPDPWHKKRHHKRRLIQPQFLTMLMQKLKQGGYIHCATDWENYAQHILKVLQENSQLKNIATDYAMRPSYRRITKFENRGIKLGHGVWDIYFTKK